MGDPWDEGPLGKEVIGTVQQRQPMPVTEQMASFRRTFDDPLTMKIGEETFAVTYGHEAEEQAVKNLIRKSRKLRTDAVAFSLPEWRANIRGRLIVCVSPRAAPAWEKLQKEITRALVTNKRPPPLSPEGNALVPRLPME